MKKTFLLLLFVMSLMYAQNTEYAFDKIMIYNSKIQGSDFYTLKEYTLYNSKNSGYYLHFHTKDSLVAEIKLFDFKKNAFYHFENIKLGDVLDIAGLFQNYHKMTVSLPSKAKKTIVTSTDSLSKRIVNIKEYKSKRKKELVSEYFIELDTTTKNLFMGIPTVDYFFRNKFVSTNDYLINRFYVKNEKGYEIWNFEAVQDTEIKLTIK